MFELASPESLAEETEFAAGGAEVEEVLAASVRFQYWAQQATDWLAESVARECEWEERFRALERERKLDSRTSDRPPAADSPAARRDRRRKFVARRPPSPRRPGGQPGHVGYTLELTDSPDAVQELRPPECTGCYRSLPATLVPLGWERRQVWELPPQRFHVQEFRACHLGCPSCGTRNSGTFPEHVPAPVQYGPVALGLALYHNQHQLVPLARLSELFAEVYGHPLCQATLLNGRQRAAAALASIQQRIQAGLGRSEVVGFDETGCYLGGDRQWLHVASTATLTDFEVGPERGLRRVPATRRVLSAVAEHGGVMLHDAYEPYYQFEGTHALCNAHLLRELTRLCEVERVPLAAALKRYLLRLKERVDQARAAGQSELPADDWQQWQRRFRRLVARGLARHPEVPPPRGRKRRPPQSKMRNVLERLRDREGDVLRFARDFRVPFDNSQAERDLRMMKVQQKISGCFRSVEGAQDFARVAGYLSTARKQGISPYTALVDLMQGHPYSPVVPT